MAVMVNRKRFIADVCRRSYWEFFQEFWPTIAAEKFKPNWHVKALCDKLQTIAERVFRGIPKEKDVLWNCPPGTSKSSAASVLWNAWIWTRMPSARFISGSYTERLAVDLSRKTRDCVMSEKFTELFPDIQLRDDQNAKSYFSTTAGGMRYAVGVGGSVLGQHGHFIVVDDPIDPQEALSDALLKSANVWMNETLSRRKVDAALVPTVLIMQRLHQYDPAGMWLEMDPSQTKIDYNTLPAELDGGWEVRPPELRSHYINGLLDPERLPRSVLDEAYRILGEVGYAGQYGQHPIPRAGAMFKVDRFQYSAAVPTRWKRPPIRYWDKAATSKGGAFTVGIKGGIDMNDQVWILDVKRGQWDSGEREDIILQTARADGKQVVVWMEVEPAGSGKEAFEGFSKRMAFNGFRAKGDLVRGDKETRADTFSQIVNAGGVTLVPAPWNHVFIEEYRYFPNSRFKDQVDAGSGMFGSLSKARIRLGAF